MSSKDYSQTNNPLSEQEWLDQKRKEALPHIALAHGKIAHLWKKTAKDLCAAAIGVGAALALTHKCAPGMIGGIGAFFAVSVPMLYYSFRHMTGKKRLKMELDKKLEPVRKEVMLAKQIEILQRRGVVLLPSIQTKEGKKFLMPFGYISPHANTAPLRVATPATDRDLIELSAELAEKLKPLAPVLAKPQQEEKPEEQMGELSLKLKAHGVDFRDMLGKNFDRDFADPDRLLRPLLLHRWKGELSFAPGRDPILYADGKKRRYPALIL